MKFFTAITLLALLSATAYAGACSDATVDFGDVVTDGVGDYENNADCTFTLPGTPSGIDRATALRFFELHVEGEFDFPCLKDAFDDCFVFSESVSSLARSDSAITSNTTLCTRSGSSHEFTFTSDSATVYAGFSAEVVDVDESECDNRGSAPFFETNGNGNPFLEEDYNIDSWDGSWIGGIFAGFALLYVCAWLCCCAIVVGVIWLVVSAASRPSGQVVYAQPGYGQNPGYQQGGYHQGGGYNNGHMSQASGYSRDNKSPY